MFDEPFYRDINYSADFYKTRKELISFLNKYLDESNYRNQMAGQAIGNLITKYNMNRKVNVINKKINSLLKSVRPIRSKKTNEIIKSVNVFDLYEGEKINENKKSVALKVLFEPTDKTLNDKEIDELSDKIILAAKSLGGSLRSQ